MKFLLLCLDRKYTWLSQGGRDLVANLEAIASGCYPVLSNIGPHVEMMNNLDLHIIDDERPEDIATFITDFI